METRKTFIRRDHRAGGKQYFRPSIPPDWLEKLGWFENEPYDLILDEEKQQVVLMLKKKVTDRDSRLAEGK